MKNYLPVYFLIFLSFSLARAQEGLRPLSANINYQYKDLRKTSAQNINTQAAKTATNFQIPFKEDFYYAYKQSYPDQLLWSDSSTYVNTGHGIAPPSAGVATFDGLNKHGWPYNPTLTNMLASMPADTLTSKPINLFVAGTQTLQPSDSVALIFYYQARGNGESPEQTDSLLLDFYKPNQQSWSSKVWFSRGNSNSNTNDTIFKRGFVWISDTAYLHDNFKFRFRNKATTAGDFDHWNVDYIYLDKGRSIITDTTFDDIAFGYIPTPLLTKYSSMPWQQYIDLEKANKQTVFIRNNNNDTTLVTNMTYENRMYDQPGVLTHSYTGGANPDLKPFRTKGWNNLPAHSNPAFNYTFTPFTDSTEFTIKHFIYRSGSSNDFIPENDTVVQKQVFRNYYAFDDGSAEGGYYINGTGGKMAVKIGLNVTDTLRALRVYFDPVGNMSAPQSTTGLATSSYKFRIIVWTDGSSGPGNLLLRDSLQPVKYYTKSSFDSAPEYTLTAPIVLGPGAYYVGIQQYVASGITVGFDKNLNHNQYLYFDSGNGWTQSSIYGSIMMRPVLGKKVYPPVGIKENIINNFAEVYPNPANTTITIQLEENKNSFYRLTNLIGQTISEGLLHDQVNSINTENLNSGVYLLTISSNNKIQNRKIIIQH